MAQAIYTPIYSPITGQIIRILTTWDYKAPHALRGTPKRPKSNRIGLWYRNVKTQCHGGRK